MRKYICVLMMSIFAMFSAIPAFANEVPEAEWFEMTVGEDEGTPEGITNPYNLYLNGVITYISYPGNYDIKLRAEVTCATTVEEIYTIFYLQKTYDGGATWKTVSEGTATKADSHYMYKNMYVYDVTPGTYRCMTNTMVTSYSGYAETAYGYSPDIDIE